MIRPIIFSAPMVKALIAGTKSQTRRLATSPLAKAEVGDFLYVREAFNHFGGGDPGILLCAADWREDAKRRGLENIPALEPTWRPSIHMPRWASRLTLEVTATKRQRIQEISDEDVSAEGLTPGDAIWAGSVKASFYLLWESLHGADSYRSNPEVVALTFKVHRCNVDAMAKESA